MLWDELTVNWDISLPAGEYGVVVGSIFTGFVGDDGALVEVEFDSLIDSAFGFGDRSICGAFPFNSSAGAVGVELSPVRVEAAVVAGLCPDFVSFVSLGH
jgi:hypothetical protein